MTIEEARKEFAGNHVGFCMSMFDLELCPGCPTELICLVMGYKDLIAKVEEECKIHIDNAKHEEEKIQQKLEERREYRNKIDELELLQKM